MILTVLNISTYHVIYLHCPLHEIICIVPQVFSVRFRHMFRDDDRITKGLLFSWMKSDSASVKEHFDDVLGKTDIDISTNQIIWNGILVFPSEMR